MNIHSISKVFLFPILLGLIGLGYLYLVNGKDVVIWFLPLLILAVILLVSMPYLDFWYMKRNPIPLDESILKWLDSYSSFYKGLDEEGKEKYRYRMSLYLYARNFMSIGTEQKNMPEDIKAIIASNAIEIAFNDDDYLIGDFDRVFVYKHPFGTPKHQFLHSVETEKVDGVIIYSLEHLIPGMVNPKAFYNIGMHAYVEAYMTVHPSRPYPFNSAADWDDVTAISGLDYNFIKSTLGYDEIDLFTVLVTCYFTYPSSFADRLPAVYEDLNRVFKRQN